MQPFCDPSAASRSVFSVSFLALSSMRFPSLILSGAPVKLVSVRPCSSSVALYEPFSVNEPSSDDHVISPQTSSLTASLCVSTTSAPLTVGSTYCATLPATTTFAVVPL